MQQGVLMKLKQKTTLGSPKEELSHEDAYLGGHLGGVSFQRGRGGTSGFL